MQQKVPPLIVILVGGSLLVGAAHSSAVTLTLLPRLQGAPSARGASDISADGRVVVGWTEVASPEFGVGALRWTPSGPALLGDLPGGRLVGVAKGVSSDGSTIVGSSESSNGEDEAFRWTAASGMAGLGDLAGGRFSSVAKDVSADGSVVVGSGTTSTTTEAFRWTPGEGMVGLGDLGGSHRFSEANAVSDDGTVIVGRGQSREGNTEAFRWTAGEGMVGLGDLVGGSVYSIANEVSPDGRVVVGISSAGPGEAFRWTLETGMIGLGQFAAAASSRSTEALGVSGDGSVVVGYGFTDRGDQAFIWDETNGIRSFASVLHDVYGIDLTAWSLDRATGISADGTTIVGTGSYFGNRIGWIAVIPEPSTALFLGFGLALLTSQRKSALARHDP